ncbi:MAG: hypothetical protein ACRENB_10385 [Gemmatimonadales bacterium]
MDEKDFERHLKSLGESWRVAPEPPLDRMWAWIESEAFGDGPRREWRWVRSLLPLAATLLVGIGIGQIAPPLFQKSAEPVAAPAALPAADGPAVQPAAHDAPFVGVATDYLERVTALLVTLATESGGRQPRDYSISQARDLLTTTRLMMDAPEPIEPRLRALLEDLELVLAQIVQLPERPNAPDVSLIDQAMDQRDVIPRLRVFLAEHNPSLP